MLRGTAVKWSAGAYRKLPRFFFILLFLSQGEEFHWPIDGNQQLFSHEDGGGRHLGRSEQADQGKTMTTSAYLQHRILSFQDSKSSQKQVQKMRRKGPWNFPQKAQRTYSDDSQAHPQPHNTPRRRGEASSCRARERSCTTVPQHYTNPHIAIGSRETFTEGAEEQGTWW